LDRVPGPAGDIPPPRLTGFCSRSGPILQQTPHRYAQPGTRRRIPGGRIIETLPAHYRIRYRNTAILRNSWRLNATTCKWDGLLYSACGVRLYGNSDGSFWLAENPGVAGSIPALPIGYVETIQVESRDAEKPG